MLKHLLLTGAVGFTQLTVVLRVRRRSRRSSSCAITIFSQHEGMISFYNSTPLSRSGLDLDSKQHLEVENYQLRSKITYIVTNDPG